MGINPSVDTSIEEGTNRGDTGEGHTGVNDAESDDTGGSAEAVGTVLVAVVAYNEADTIFDVVMGAQNVSDEVLVVDDGSTDETARLAREAGASVVRHRTNQGYGAALKTAFEEATGRGPDYLVTIDGDGQHRPADVRTLVEAQHETDADLLVGSRYLGGRTSDIPLYRRLGLAIVNTATSVSLGISNRPVSLTDTQCGLRSYQPDLYRSLADAGDIGSGMEASTDILYHAVERDYDIKEAGVRVRYDLPDTSYEHPLSHGVTLLANIVEHTARRHPFLVISLALVPGVLIIRRLLLER